MFQMCDRAAAQRNIQNQSVQSYKRPNTAQEEMNFLKQSSLIQVCFYKGEFPVSHAPPESERQRHRKALITLKLLDRHAVTPWNPSLENCPNDRRELPVRRPAAGSVFKHLTSCAGSSSVIIPAL